MAQNTTLLILRLEGVLQSWGERSKWDDRDTASMPTKSGIVGMLACAMGLERNSAEIPALSQAIRIGIRADRCGTLIEDFQTVRPLENYDLLNAEGKPRGSSNTFISRRQYLQDASFLVVIEAGMDWQIRIREALQNPRWPICLGRKNCVPTRPILAAVCVDYPDILSLIKAWPAADRADPVMPYECETALPELVSVHRLDERLTGYRSFAYRTVYRGAVKGELKCT